MCGFYNKQTNHKNVSFANHKSQISLTQTPLTNHTFTTSFVFVYRC